jgi:hypothetical protein
LTFKKQKELEKLGKKSKNSTYVLEKKENKVVKRKKKLK